MVTGAGRMWGDVWNTRCQHCPAFFPAVQDECTCIFHSTLADIDSLSMTKRRDPEDLRGPTLYVSSGTSNLAILSFVGKPWFK